MKNSKRSVAATTSIKGTQLGLNRKCRRLVEGKKKKNNGVPGLDRREKIEAGGFCFESRFHLARVPAGIIKANLNRVIKPAL